MATTGRRLKRGEGAPFSFQFDGEAIDAWPGESVAAALLAAGRLALRQEAPGHSRGLVCAIGVCWECRLVIDGEANRRACMTEARPGIRVATQQGLGG